MADTVESSEVMGVGHTPSRASSLFRRMSWLIFGFALFLIFTLMKLPEDRLKNFIQNTISNALAPKGITFTAESGELSLRMGGAYILSNISLNFPNATAPVTIDSIEISPSFLSLLRGRVGGQLDLENKGGSLKGSFSAKDDDLALDLHFNTLDLGKLGALQLLAGIKGALVLDGSLDLSGSFSTPTSINGDVGIDINGLGLDQQSIMGFNVPKIAVSTGRIDAGIDKGKLTIRTVRLGKAGSLDDIQATVTGDITLQRMMENSVMNLKTRFTLSQTILKSFILIDALLGPGKQPDGSYAFKLSGPMSAPFSTPGT